MGWHETSSECEGASSSMKETWQYSNGAVQVVQKQSNSKLGAPP